MSEENLIGTEAGISTSIVQQPLPEITIASLREQALGLLQYASERIIRTIDDTKSATEDLSIIAKSKKWLEDKRKEYVTPLNNQAKVINDTFKLVSDPLNQADKITRDKILAFREEQERKRREVEAIEAEKLALARREAELKDGEITIDLTPIEKPDAVPDRIITDIGTSNQRDNWKWQVTDLSQVPREYLMINAGMVTPIVKASKGKLTIPGIRIYNEPIIAVNTK